ncbi:MAG: F0F1 ATP synthase subunit gamma [Oscillospiraceae bacterium]|nr:F0F1 ATP synthase subunit gamma [Oscillospiraceae bacterium]
MATIQSLKKKLQVIRSTQKLTQAMKTASTVKYSRISGIYSGFKKYEQSCSELYECYREELNGAIASHNPAAPVCYLVFASNKGMCGSFNSEVLAFAEKTIQSQENPPTVLLCGKKAEAYFNDKKIAFQKSYTLSDVPTMTDAGALFEDITSMLRKGEISSLKVIYPKYKNMMVQYPVCRDLFSESSDHAENTASKGNTLFVPDRVTVIKNSARNILVSIIYGIILETALGAQAATLTTMRSAYDTASEYCTALEVQINRMRQSQVTADIADISAEFLIEKEE